MKALITVISSEYLRSGIDLEQGLVERQVGVLEVLVQLGLERLGVGGDRRLADHDLRQAARPSPALRMVGKVRSEAGRLSDGLSVGASAVIAVAGWAGAGSSMNCPSAGAGL